VIVLTVDLRAKPERRNELLAIAQAYVPLCRAEHGCLSYLFYEQQPHRNNFFSLQQWRDGAAVEAHLRTPHFRSLMDRLPELIERPPEVRQYEVSEYREISIRVVQGAESH
jgi:quinol monooxygenase YgiN